MIFNQSYICLALLNFPDGCMHVHVCVSFFKEMTTIVVKFKNYDFQCVCTGLLNFHFRIPRRFDTYHTRGIQTASWSPYWLTSAFFCDHPESARNGGIDVWKQSVWNSIPATYGIRVLICLSDVPVRGIKWCQQFENIFLQLFLFKSSAQRLLVYQKTI